MTCVHLIICARLSGALFTPLTASTLKNNFVISLSFFLILLTGALNAQREEIKFGKIGLEDRKMMSLPSDTTAEAYVLHDELSLAFIQDPDGRPMLKEYRHRRLKLFTAASFDRADIEIIYSRENNRISKLRAAIHFPDGGAQKLAKSDFIRERYDDDRDIYKFTFPGVREGATIEYSYVQTDKNIVIPSRYFFQESIPVRWAEYKALIPSYFNYVSLSTGANDYNINKVAAVNGYFGGDNINTTDIHWAMKDLAAYDIQPYVNNFGDYLPQVRMQLQSVQYPGRPPQKVFSDWKETTTDLDGWADFGKSYRIKSNSNKVWKDVEPLLSGKSSETEKAQEIYNFVTGKISWDGNYRWTAERTPNKVYDAAQGSSGEISILLLALLKQAGITAKPLLVPLRNGGEPIEIYPLLNQFDHLMVLATLDGKEMILDPNSIHRPMGLPRRSALNHRAFVADPENPHWTDVETSIAAKTVMVDIALDEEGVGEVGLKSRLQSYYGFSAREQMDEMENDNEFPMVGEILENFPETELISKEVQVQEDESGPVNINMKLKVPMGQAVDDYLYLQPILFHVLNEGLADVEQRLYPVDFGHPSQERYIANITLPEGYVVDELPKSQRITSQDKALSVTFAAEDKGSGLLSLNFTVAIRRTVFKANEYAGLRELFRNIIELQETTIVLKKAE